MDCFAVGVEVEAWAELFPRTRLSDFLNYIVPSQVNRHTTNTSIIFGLGNSKVLQVQAVQVKLLTEPLRVRTIQGTLSSWCTWACPKLLCCPSEEALLLRFSVSFEIV